MENTKYKPKALSNGGEEKQIGTKNKSILLSSKDDVEKKVGANKKSIVPNSKQDKKKKSGANMKTIVSNSKLDEKKKGVTVNEPIELSSGDDESMKSGTSAYPFLVDEESNDAAIAITSCARLRCATNGTIQLNSSDDESMKSGTSTNPFLVDEESNDAAIASTSYARRRGANNGTIQLNSSNDESMKSGTSTKPSLVDEDSNDAAIAASSRATSNSKVNRRSKSRGRPRRQSTKSKSKPKPNYKFSMSATEKHKDPILGIVFNCNLSQNEPQIFATLGKNRCSIYKCTDEGGIELLNCFADPNVEESFYTCTWSYSRNTLHPLVIVGGKLGIIRIINPHNQQNTGKVAVSLIGHGGAINQLKIHPIHVQLLLSGSEDYSIRLWNMETRTLIAIFGGVDGHRDQVLSIDFNLRGERFVSGGMDHSLKIWDLSNKDVNEAIKRSSLYNAKLAFEQFPTLMQSFPTFSTRNIHVNYIDCVQWFGDYIISKSVENRIVMWHIVKRDENGKENEEAETIEQFDCDYCELWFVRFDFNNLHKLIACGNDYGQIYVHDLNQRGPDHFSTYVLSRKDCTTVMRQVAFSKDASVLVGVCDDGTIWRWNKVV